MFKGHAACWSKVELKSDLKVASVGRISLLFCPFNSAASFILSRRSACHMAQIGREITHLPPSSPAMVAIGVTSTHAVGRRIGFFCDRLPTPSASGRDC